MRRWRRFYGHHPLHLVLMLACFALVALVVSFVVDSDDAEAPLVLVWFVGAVLAGDLVLYPTYALADRFLVLGRWIHRRIHGHAPRVPLINHLRVPAILSGVLGLVALPTITRRGEDALRFTSTRTDAGYLADWLTISVALFGVSAVIYAVRVARSWLLSGRARSADDPAQ